MILTNKALLLILALFTFTQVSKAQSENYKPVKFDILLGYASPDGKGVKGGVAISGELKYNVTDNLAIGLKGETALVSILTNAANDDVSARAIGSYTLTTERYLSETGVRPFFGGAVGVFTYGTVLQTNGTSTTTVNGGSKFGGGPRIGLQMGHFRIVGEYNFVGGGNNYLTAKLGFTIGGGRK